MASKTDSLAHLPCICSCMDALSCVERTELGLDRRLHLSRCGLQLCSRRGSRRPVGTSQPKRRTGALCQLHPGRAAALCASRHVCLAASLTSMPSTTCSLPHSPQALLLYGLLRGVPSETAWLWFAVLIGGILPTGLLSINGDRPETPAFCLLAALLLMWREDRSASFKVILVGLNSLVFLIHPFAGVVGCLLFCFLLTFTLRQPQAPARRCLIAGAGFIVMFLTIAACAFAMWRLDPASLHRFVVHATTLNAPVQQAFRNSQGTGVDSAGGAAALHANPPNASEHVGYITAFRHIFNSGTVLGGVGVISLLVAFIAIGAFVLYSRSLAEATNKCRLQFLVACPDFAGPSSYILSSPGELLRPGSWVPASDGSFGRLRA